MSNKNSGDPSNVQWKVGLFVFISLIVLAALMLNFSKGLRAFTPTYTIKLVTSSVSGLKEAAEVQMAGVSIGKVDTIDLRSDGKTVSIELKIQERYKIHGDAGFSIQQSGFLGDQFVSIVPGKNKAAFLKNGDSVTGEEPFNLQEAAKSAQSLIERVDETVLNLNNALLRVDSTLLAQQNLTNLTSTIENFRAISQTTLNTVGNFETFSEKSLVAADDLSELVHRNRPMIDQSISNLVGFTTRLQSITNMLEFTENLNQMSGEILGTVTTNRESFTRSMQNLESSTEMTRLLLEELQAGKGTVGSLLKDELLQQRISLTASNLTILSSNLTRFGLLYKPKKPKTRTVPAKSIYTGRSPFQK